jgi:hypothetical protein
MGIIIPTDLSTQAADIALIGFGGTAPAKVSFEMRSVACRVVVVFVVDSVVAVVIVGKWCVSHVLAPCYSSTAIKQQ